MDDISTINPKTSSFRCRDCGLILRYFENNFDILLERNNIFYVIYIDTSIENNLIQITSYIYESDFPVEMKEHSLNNIELDKDNIEKSSFNILLKFINNLEFL